MYPIDFTTCSPEDVIARSVICHPTTLRDELCRIVTIHISAANTMTFSDTTAHKIALDMAKAAERMACLLADGDDLTSVDDFSSRIILFGACARLQCVSSALARDIVARGSW